MKNHHKLVLTILLSVIVGCSSKSKTVNDEVTAAGERVGTESMDFEIRGSDSGNIAGLNTVYFDFDKSTLSRAELKKLSANAEWLKSNGSKKMLIEGHTDQTGSAEYNLSLGERRAVYVKNQLVKLGIKTSRLTVSSFGKEKPLASGDSEQVMAKNRRANFVPQ